METWYTAEDVAKITRLGTETVWRKCRNREWPHMKVGRHYKFTDAEIEEIKEVLKPIVVTRVRRNKRQPIN